MKYLLIGLILSSIYLPGVSVAGGPGNVGTGFTYQGELLINNSPANGVFDFEFVLYDENVSSNVIDTETVEDLQIVHGLIATELNFGDAAFMGEERWIQINIRPGNDTGGFQGLSPRQRINVNPYAIQSAFVENGSTPWNLNDDSSGINYIDGIVIIGAGTPNNSKLKVYADSGKSPFRADISDEAKLIVNSNGGTSIGDEVSAPIDGIYVKGNAHQYLSSHGFVKAGAEVSCSGIDSTVIRFFNNVNSQNISASGANIPGRCSITAPFDASRTYIVASGILEISPGLSPKDASCVVTSSSPSSSVVICQATNSGISPTISDADIQLLFY